MHLGPAARGFLALLLSAPALQGNNDLKNTDTSSTVCAVRRSTLNISCDYEYPDNGQNSNTTETLWFTKPDRNTLIDIRNDANYGGRVEYSCGDMRCTGSKCHRTCALKIKDLGESDSAEYEFKFRRDQSAEEYSCYPGLNLSVTDLQLKLVFLDSNQPNVVDLECHSTFGMASSSYKWFRNGQRDGQGRYYKGIINSQDSYSCAVEGYQHLQTPSVYAPKNLSVTVIPSGEIEEGSSVTLSCSSDANPAAEYSWFKEHEDSVVESGQNYIISNITSELGGHYYCQAHNAIGRRNSTLLFVNVTASSSSLTTAVAVRISVCSLVSILLFLVFIWIGKRRPSRRAPGLGEAAELPGEEEEVRDRNEGL